MNKKADDYESTGVDSEKARSGSGISLRRLKTFESFKTPVFRIYYSAMAGQWFAQGMQMMARNLLVYRLTGSGAVIGMMALAHALPLLIVSLLGGAVADRMQKKYILIAGQMGSALIALIIALILSAGYLNAERWWILLVAAVFQGSVMGFMMPSRMAIIPEIVSKNSLMNAISLTTMGQTGLRLVGPALAGFLIDAYDFAAIYYFMTGMYLIGTSFAVFLPRTGTTTIRKGNPLADIIAGFRYIRGDKTILLIVVYGLLHVVAGQPYRQLLPMFTEDILKVEASGMGILTSVSGVGAVVGALVLASMPIWRRGLLLLLSGIIMGLSLIVFSWSHWWVLSLSIIPLVGLGPTMHSALTNTLVQYYVEPDYRGRMQSFVMMGFGLASFGTFLAGVMSEAIGVQWSVGGMAMLLTIVSFLFLIFTPRLRNLN